MKHLVALVVALVACKGGSSGGGDPPPAAAPPAAARPAAEPRVPPPPTQRPHRPTLYPFVDKTDAVIPLAAVPRPARVVWIGASGSIEAALPDKVWTGALPSARTPRASLDVLGAEVDPAPDREPDPWRVAVNDDLERGYERAPVAIGVRGLDAPQILLMGAPGAPALNAVAAVELLGGYLGVVQKDDQLGALRLAFRPKRPVDALDETRQQWVELHLGAAGIDALALPANGIMRVPWVKDSADAPAVIAILRGFGKQLPKVDVFVGAGVSYQQLIETLIAVDAAGLTTVGLGTSPGPVEGRQATIAALPNTRTGFRSATAILKVGQPNAQGDLDKALIRRGIRGKLVEITACYDAGLAKNPQLRGTVSTQFFITPNGDVASASGSGVDPVVATCVAEVVKTIAFPKPRGGGGVQVNYPFTFRPIEI